jgi:hypothetical protein
MLNLSSSRIAVEDVRTDLEEALRAIRVQVEAALDDVQTALGNAEARLLGFRDWEFEDHPPEDDHDIQELDGHAEKLEGAIEGALAEVEATRDAVGQIVQAAEDADTWASCLGETMDNARIADDEDGDGEKEKEKDHG